MLNELPFGMYLMLILCFFQAGRQTRYRGARFFCGICQRGLQEDRPDATGHWQRFHSEQLRYYTHLHLLVLIRKWTYLLKM